MASRAIPFRRPILRLEEAAGLVVAVAIHVALGVWLAHQRADPPVPLPERMTVTFSADVADQSTAPKPVAEAAPAIAPVVSADPVPDPAPEPVATPVRAPRSEPLSRQPSAPKAQPIPLPKPQPPAKVQLQPKPLPQAKPSPSAKPLPAKQVTPPKPAMRPAPAPAKAPPPARSAGGASRFGDAFRSGIPGGQNPAVKATEAPAQAIGPAVKSALSGAIARQLKPKWSAPQGAEADQLVTVLSWELNPDGTLAGPPRLVSQTGVTDANRPQAQRHVEQAMRAVRLAAPFDLPADLYPAWKRVGKFSFDRKLSQ